MIQRNAIKLVTALALLAGACGDDDPKPADEKDAATVDASRPDAGGDAAFDARTGNDANTGTPDTGTPSPADAATDAAEPVDAAPTLDATVDAGVDASTDAALVSDAAADAQVDAFVPSLVAWYKFDETSGTNATDSTDNFADGVLQSGATLVAGKSGNAVDLAGGAGNTSAPYVSLPPNLVAECQDVTIALWMKLGSISNWSRLLEVDGVVNGFFFFTPAADIDGAPHLYFDIFYPVPPDNNPPGPEDDQRISAAYPANTTLLNTWHHVAFTQSGSTARLYFDGAEIGTAQFNKSVGDVMIGSAPNVHAWLGKSMFGDPYLDASIDDLRISCSAFSAQQIADLAK